MSLLFKGKLLKIESNLNDKNELSHSLVFPWEKYDKGLGEVVRFSQKIKLHEDDFKYLHVFESYVGKDIAVPVYVSTTMKGMAIFFKTTGEGLKLFKDVTSEVNQTVQAKP